jgi:hypothetical protein
VAAEDRFAGDNDSRAEQVHQLLGKMAAPGHWLIAQLAHLAQEPEGPAYVT